MADVEAIKKLVRFQTDAWITQKLEDLASELSQGRQYTSISEAGKSHAEAEFLPISEVVSAVTDVAYERGLNASGNTKTARATFARIG